MAVTAVLVCTRTPARMTRLRMRATSSVLVGPLRHVGGRGDQGDVEALCGKQFGDHPTQVVVVVVEDHDALPVAAAGPP